MSVNSIKVDPDLSLSIQLFLTFIRNFLISSEILIIFISILEVKARNDPFLSIDEVHQVFNSWIKFDPEFTGEMPVQSYIKFLFQLGHPLGVKDISKTHLKERRNNQLFNKPSPDFFEIKDRVSKFNISIYKHLQKENLKTSKKLFKIIKNEDRKKRKGKIEKLKRNEKKSEIRKPAIQKNHTKILEKSENKFLVHFIDFVTLLSGSIVASNTNKSLQEYSTHRVQKLIKEWKTIFPNYLKVELFQEVVKKRDLEFKKKQGIQNEEQSLITYDLTNFMTINRLVYRIKNYQKKNHFMKKQILQSSISRTIKPNQANYMMKKTFKTEKPQNLTQLKCPVHSEGIYRDFYMSNKNPNKEGFTSCLCPPLQTPRSEIKPNDVYDLDSNSSENDSFYSSKENNSTKVVYVFPNFKN